MQSRVFPITAGVKMGRLLYIFWKCIFWKCIFKIFMSDCPTISFVLVCWLLTYKRNPRNICQGDWCKIAKKKKKHLWLRKSLDPCSWLCCLNATLVGSMACSTDYVVWMRPCLDPWLCCFKATTASAARFAGLANCSLWGWIQTFLDFQVQGWCFA